MLGSTARRGRFGGGSSIRWHGGGPYLTDEPPREHVRARVGQWLSETTRFLFGSIAITIPVLLVAGAIRLMRAPADSAHRGRVIVGWSAIFLGAAGLLHLGFHQPSAPAQMEKAGGLLGTGS